MVDELTIGGDMTRNNLPPGPWSVARVRNPENPLPIAVVDADGLPILSFDARRGCLIASPEVLRAIEDIPLLIEAARRIIEVDDDLHLFPELHQLRDALARIETARSGAREDQ